MSSQKQDTKKKTQCSRFEPQTWRKTLCKNCFKTRSEHPDEEPGTPDSAFESICSSPEVLDGGDKIIIRRSLSTPPPPEIQDFAFVGKRGQDGSRKTPVRDLSSGRKDAVSDGKKDAGIVVGAAAGFRSSTDGKSGKVEEKVSSLPDNTPPEVKGGGGVQSIVEVKKFDSGQPLSKPLTKGADLQTDRKSVTTTEHGAIEVANAHGQSREVSKPLEEGAKLSLVVKADAEEKVSKDGLSAGGHAPESTKVVGKETENDVPTSSASSSSSTTIFNREVQLPANAVSRQTSEEAGQSSSAAADVGRVIKPGPSGVQGSPQPRSETSGTSVHKSEQITKVRGRADNEGKEEEETNAGIRREVCSSIENSSNSNSNSNNTDQADASAEIAGPGTSYVHSLQVSLSAGADSSVAAGEEVGVDSARNSYGIRHDSECCLTNRPSQQRQDLENGALSTSPSISLTPSSSSTAGAAFVAAAAPAGASASATSSKLGEDFFRSSAAATIGSQLQLENSDSNGFSLPNHRETRSLEENPIGLEHREGGVGGGGGRSIADPYSQANHESKIAADLGKVSARPTHDVRDARSQAAGGLPGAYQFVDASDSRLSYNVIDGGKGVPQDQQRDFYYLSGGESSVESALSPFDGVRNQDLVGAEPPSVDQTGRKVTSLFHHVPGDGQSADQTPSPVVIQQWNSNEPPFRSQTDDELASYGSQGVASGPSSSSRRRRRSKVISLDDSNDPSRGAMSCFEYGRSDAMMEGTRIVMESLREKVVLLQEQCERLEREKTAIGDLLAAKKSDYELMKDHFNGNVCNLEMEVQRLKSEKSRLLDKLQLPESERASLAAEENEIAELKKRLEEYENRYTEVVGENDDLKQEVRDLQLEMEEMHDQFREEETIEFRELQKELENTAKNCRILQFKLRKSERRNEQLESDRLQYDEKLRQYESCLQSSDDKRRIRVLEEDLRLARESAVRLHSELERAEDRRLKHQEELDRAKNSVNEADNKRLCLQNELDSMKHEMNKLRGQMRYEGRQDLIKVGTFRIGSESDVTVTQLTKDLKDSVERENDLKEQLKFSEEENATMRKKLVEMEEETESMSLQLRKLSSAKSGRYVKGKCGDAENKPETERESELRLQMELAEQEVKVLKRKMDELQQDNDNLLCAIKYLRSKLEQRDGTRCATPIGDSKSTRELLTRIGAAVEDPSGELRLTDEAQEELKASQLEARSLRERVEELEKEKTRLLEHCRQFQSMIGSVEATEQEKVIDHSGKETGDEIVSTEKNLMKTVEELELLLMQEKEKLTEASVDKQKTEATLMQEKQQLTEELSTAKEELKRVTEEVENLKKDFEQTQKDLQATKDDLSKVSVSKDLEETNKALANLNQELSACKEDLTKRDKELTELKEELASAKKKISDNTGEKPKEESKKMSEMKSKLTTLQKTLDDLQADHDKLLKEQKDKSKSASTSSLVKDKEPASWRWEKQDLEKQVKELKKKCEDLQTETKKTSIAKSQDTVKENGKEKNDQYKKEAEELKNQLEEVQEKLKKREKEKEKLEKELKDVKERVKEKEKELKDTMEKVKEKGDSVKSKDSASKPKDDTASEKKKLMKELDEERKRAEELSKEKDDWNFERKKLLQERDAAVKERNELKGSAAKETDDISKRATPFGLRSRMGTVGKSQDTGDAAKVKELMESLEKKENELKALKTKVEAKGAGEKLAKEAADLKKEKEKLECDLEEAVAEKKTLKSKVQQLKEKLKANEELWSKEKTKMEDELKQATDKGRKTFRSSDDSKLIQENEALVKEKQKLSDDVTKLKKELGESTKQRSSDKEDFEKSIKEKVKALEASQTTCEELQKEIERLKSQVGTADTKAAVSGSSKVVTIPVQPDNSTKMIPIQKISKSSSSTSSSSSASSSKDQELNQKAELVALEETHNAKIKTLEEELSSLREQLSTLQKDSESQTQKSQKSFSDLKSSFDKEFSSWSKEREIFKKSEKLVDDYAAKVFKLDKTVEELSGKLKVEEAKRREVEVKFLAQENASKADKTTTSSEDKPKAVVEEKTVTGQKTAEFRNRFEKFGGTPRPVRKMSLPTSSSSTTSSEMEKGDWVSEIQKQMTEAEKARLKDREEMLEKLERQKKDFELRLEAFKETTKLLDAKSQEISVLEKQMAEINCQLEDERAKWVKERSKLQSQLSEAQQSGKDDKGKVAELMGEVKKLQLLVSGKTSTLPTPSSSQGTEKSGVKTKGAEASQNSTSSPVTSIVIPIRKVEDEKKTPVEDGTTGTASSSNGVGKLSKKLFPPFAAEPSSSTKTFTTGQRTPIPINRIGRSSQPKL